MEKIKIQTYGRQELASLYYPNILPKSAWEKLREELQLNPDLRPLLRSTRHTFTPRAVQLIFEILGAPEI